MFDRYNDFRNRINHVCKVADDDDDDDSVPDFPAAHHERKHGGNSPAVLPASLSLSLWHFETRLCSAHVDGVRTICG